MKHTLRHLVATMLLLASVLGLGAVTGETPAVANSDCASGIGIKTPVILVHGLLSGASVWGEDQQSNSMVHTLHMVPDLDVKTFDYSAYHTRWVTDQHVGPALAAQIHCEAAASRAAGGPGKVVVIGHSMGGLATRFAAAQTVDGHPVANDIGLVITIGTPNLGSGLANEATGLIHALCDEAQQYSCDQILSARGSAFGGLSDNSKEFKELAWLPRNIPTLAIAGDVTFHMPVFMTTASWNTESDLVVAKSSALQDIREMNGSGGSATISCDKSVPLTLSMPSCWHSGLPHNETVEQKVLHAIGDYRRSIGTTIHFHGLNLKLPSNWQRGVVYDNHFPGSQKDIMGIRTGGSCLSAKGVTSCPGFEIHGPNALVVDQYANGHHLPGGTYSSGPWNRSDSVFSCSANPKLVVNGLPTKPKVQSFAPIGSKTAAYSEWTFSCVDTTGGSATFVERLWWLPRTKLLIVDDWNTPGLAEALKNTTWN